MATTTQTSASVYDKAVEPYIDDYIREAQEIYAGGVPAYYPGETVAGLDPLRAKGWESAAAAADGPLAALANQGTSALSGFLTGQGDSARRLAELSGGAVSGGFAGQGSLGSARHSYGASKAAADTIAQNQLQAIGLIGEQQRNILTPAETQSRIGAQRQAYEQNLIDADKARYDYNVGAPTAWLKDYGANIGLPNTGAGGTTTSTSKKASPLETILGIGSFLTGIGGRAEGGMIPGYQTGGTVTPGFQNPQWDFSGESPRIIEGGPRPRHGRDVVVRQPRLNVAATGSGPQASVAGVGGSSVGRTVIPNAAESHLKQDEFDNYVDTIRSETGWSDYDPYTDVIYGTEYEDKYRSSDAAQEAADNIYMNVRVPGGDTSLSTGVASNVTAGDHAKAAANLAANLYEKTPAGSVVVPAVRGRSDDNDRKSSIHNPKTAAEYAIDREVKDYAATGRKFDRDDSSTWSDDAQKPVSSSSSGGSFSDTVKSVGSSVSRGVKSVTDKVKSWFGAEGGEVPGYAEGGSVSPTWLAMKKDMGMM